MVEPTLTAAELRSMLKQPVARLSAARSTVQMLCREDLDARMSLLYVNELRIALLGNQDLGTVGGSTGAELPVLWRTANWGDAEAADDEAPASSDTGNWSLEEIDILIDDVLLIIDAYTISNAVQEGSSLRAACESGYSSTPLQLIPALMRARAMGFAELQARGKTASPEMILQRILNTHWPTRLQSTMVALLGELDLSAPQRYLLRSRLHALVADVSSNSSLGSSSDLQSQLLGLCKQAPAASDIPLAHAIYPVHSNLAQIYAHLHLRLHKLRSFPTPPWRQTAPATYPTPHPANPPVTK